MLSASTADFPAAAPPTVRAEPAARDTPWYQPSARQFYVTLIVVSLVVGGLSLLIPSTPSYDPWAWLVWGREIVHVNLQTTGGPTWKPLPVVFTTIFALFGKAQPDLWLVVARAGAFASVVMLFRLSYSLTRQIAVATVKPAARLERSIAFGPALLAGLVAVIGITFSSGFISNNALGYSEGLATAVVLIALERHLAGKPRQAFAIGFLAALDRPEIWLFWGPYGLYLFWKDPEARKLVIGLFVLIPILWFLPEYWGSGHFLRGVSRAQHVRSNSLALAKCPFCSELKDAAWPTILLRIKVAAAGMVLVVGVVLARRWRRDGRPGMLAPPKIRAQATAALAGVTGVVWFVVIAILTQAGFSGNNRYLVIGSALIEVCGAVAWGWAALALGRAAGRLLDRGREPSSAGVGVAVWTSVAVLGALFALLPPWVGNDVGLVQRTHRALVYQASLRDGAADVIDRYGGPAKVLRCGTVMTEGFQVPMVAWTLGVHTLRVLGPAPSGTPPGPAPNVILQTRASRN
ncbi:MAG: hypothetical protein ACJ8H8_33480, partial [Geminicoccaceae bacterium]